MALIINNTIWNRRQLENNRKGSEDDVTQFKKVAKFLKYEIIEKADLTAEGMKTAVSEVAAKVREDQDSFICCIMSHGNDRGIEGVDSDDCIDIHCNHDNDECENNKGVVTATELAALVGCRNLANKPKIFIIQACRGDEIQQPVVYDSRPRLHVPRLGNHGNRSRPIPVPPTADYFFAYSTAPNTKSVRCLYIQILSKIFLNHAKKLSLYKLMMLVHIKMAESEYPHPTTNVRCCQLGEIVSSLRMTVHFK